MTRVANVALYRNVLLSNQRNLSTASDLQQQLASGKRLQQMSDDPVAGRRSLIFRVQRFEFERYQENIDKSLSFMQTTDSAFSRMSEVIDEAKQLAVRGATATEDAASRNVLAQAMDGLRERMVDLGNTVHDGRYVFSGNAVLTRPFELDPARGTVNYQGDLADFSVSISTGTRVAVNLDGHALFKEEVDVFKVFTEISDALRADDPEAVNDLIADLDVTQRHLAGKQGELGARVQRVELTRVQIEEAAANLGELISAEEDVDLAETISKLQVAEVALQAGLNAGARVVQPTLLDFL